MSEFDQLLKNRAAQEDCCVSSSFDSLVEYSLENLPEQQRKRSGRPMRVVLVAAALCVLCAVSALAVSPSLREALAEILGGFEPYMQDIDEAVCVQDGVEVKVIAAVADSYMTRVYAEVRDWEGDWLTADRRIVGFIDRKVQEENSRQISDAIFIESGKCVEFDEENNTALLEFKSWGNFSDDLGSIKLRIFSFCMNSPEERSGELDWEIDLDVEILTKREIPLSGAVDDLELVEAEISTLGIMLLTEGTVGIGKDHLYSVHLEDGTVVYAHTAGGMMTGENDGVNRNYLEFDDPVNPEQVIAISIGDWMIPFDNNTAGEATG